MKKGIITFAAVFNDGSFVEKNNFEEISNLTSAFFFLKIEFFKEHTTSFGNTYYYFWFKPIDKDGQPTTIRIGNFEIIDIKPEDGSYYEKGIAMKILDVKENTVHEFKTDKNGLSRFREEIFPVLLKLNELGSWSNYLSFQKGQQAELKNEELMQKIENLNQIIEKLSAENKELKSKIEKIV